MISNQQYSATNSPHTQHGASVTEDNRAPACAELSTYPHIQRTSGLVGQIDPQLFQNRTLILTQAFAQTELVDLTDIIDVFCTESTGPKTITTKEINT
ncbi:MAG: hypothetical protein AAF413_00240 [Patescibacteria group bacterium]